MNGFLTRLVVAVGVIGLVALVKWLAAEPRPVPTGDVRAYAPVLESLPLTDEERHELDLTFLSIVDPGGVPE